MQFYTILQQFIYNGNYFHAFILFFAQKHRYFIFIYYLCNRILKKAYFKKIKFI